MIISNREQRLDYTHPRRTTCHVPRIRSLFPIKFNTDAAVAPYRLFLNGRQVLSSKGQREIFIHSVLHFTDDPDDAVDSIAVSKIKLKDKFCLGQGQLGHVINQNAGNVVITTVAAIYIVTPCFRAEKAAIYNMDEAADGQNIRRGIVVVPDAATQVFCASIQGGLQMIVFGFAKYGVAPSQARLSGNSRRRLLNV